MNCGVVSCGVVGCSAVRCGVGWYGVEWSGVVEWSVVCRCSVVVIRVVQFTHIVRLKVVLSLLFLAKLSTVRGEFNLRMTLPIRLFKGQSTPRFFLNTLKPLLTCSECTASLG